MTDCEKILDKLIKPSLKTAFRGAYSLGYYNIEMATHNYKVSVEYDQCLLDKRLYTDRINMIKRIETQIDTCEKRFDTRMDRIEEHARGLK
jgi:hypothetical protein